MCNDESWWYVVLIVLCTWSQEISRNGTCCVHVRFRLRWSLMALSMGMLCLRSKVPLLCWRTWAESLRKVSFRHNLGGMSSFKAHFSQFNVQSASNPTCYSRLRNVKGCLCVQYVQAEFISLRLHLNTISIICKKISHTYIYIYISNKLM